MLEGTEQFWSGDGNACAWAKVIPCVVLYAATLLDIAHKMFRASDELWCFFGLSHYKPRGARVTFTQVANEVVLLPHSRVSELFRTAAQCRVHHGKVNLEFFGQCERGFRHSSEAAAAVSQIFQFGSPAYGVTAAQVVEQVVR